MKDDATGDTPFFYVLKDALHIMFVDDDPIIREFAAVHLSSDEGRVSLAGDGEAALDLLAADLPDIMLLDLEMPRMDGFETLARLRAEPRTRHLPVIVVTGREDVSAIDRAFDAGATSFVVKPINWRLLSYQVRYVRRAHQAELALGRLEAAREHAAAAQAQLLTMTNSASSLIRLAMQGGPEARRAALQYATLIAELHDGERGDVGAKTGSSAA